MYVSSPFKYMKDLLFVAATHGDEKIGVEMADELKNTVLRKKFDLVIANQKAFKLKKRFLESDLNRVFPGKGNTYEERRARALVKIGKKYKEVIDLHGSMSKTGIFIIVTKNTKKNLLLAVRLGIKRIVIWTGVKETNGSLSTFMPTGLEIESGFRDDPKIKKKLKIILTNFLENYEKKIDFKKELKKREIFRVMGKLKKIKKKPSRLKNWQKINGYYPLFVGGQYKTIWCYKLKKISLKI